MILWIALAALSLWIFWPKRSLPPGPLQLPLIGHLHLLYPYARIYQFHSFIAHLSRTYGDITYFHIFGENNVIIASSDEAKRILTISDFGRGTILQNVFHGLLKNALFLLPQGVQWKKHRKLLQPAFGPLNVRYTFDVALEIMDKVSQFLDAKIAASENASKTLNVHELFAAIALDVIGLVAFSKNLENVEALLDGRELTDSYRMTSIVAEIADLRLSVPSFLWKFFGLGSEKMEQAVRPIKHLLEQVIQDRRRAGVTLRGQGKSDIVDRLLQKSEDGQEMLSDEEISEEVVSFFFAGHETTANTLTSIIRRLCETPECLEKLVKEIRALPDITWDTIQSCKYLDHVIKEGLRLDPTVAVLGKLSFKEVQVLGHHFPPFVHFGKKNHAHHQQTQFILDIWSIHRDPRYWPDPLTFNPSRWENSPEPGTYLPFGDGPTNCIGQKIAIIEMKCVIARLLSRYDLELVPGQDLQEITTITTGLKNGVDIVFTFSKPSSQ